jgi:hypothetical protein
MHGRDHQPRLSKLRHSLYLVFTFDISVCTIFLAARAYEHRRAIGLASKAFDPIITLGVQRIVSKSLDTAAFSSVQC